MPFLSLVLRSWSLQLRRFSSESHGEPAALFDLGPARDPGRAAQPNPTLPGSNRQHNATEVSEHCKPIPSHQHTPRDQSVAASQPAFSAVLHPWPRSQVNLPQVLMYSRGLWLCVHAVPPSSHEDDSLASATSLCCVLHNCAWENTHQSGS